MLALALQHQLALSTSALQPVKSWVWQFDTNRWVVNVHWVGLAGWPDVHGLPGYIPWSQGESISWFRFRKCRDGSGSESASVNNACLFSFMVSSWIWVSKRSLGCWVAGQSVADHPGTNNILRENIFTSQALSNSGVDAAPWGGQVQVHSSVHYLLHLLHWIWHEQSAKVLVLKARI